MMKAKRKRKASTMLNLMSSGHWESPLYGGAQRLQRVPLLLPPWKPLLLAYAPPPLPQTPSLLTFLVKTRTRRVSWAR